jgi:hypothetical protein
MLVGGLVLVATSGVFVVLEEGIYHPRGLGVQAILAALAGGGRRSAYGFVDFRTSRRIVRPRAPIML